MSLRSTEAIDSAARNSTDHHPPALYLSDAAAFCPCGGCGTGAVIPANQKSQATHVPSLKIV